MGFFVALRLPGSCDRSRAVLELGFPNPYGYEDTLIVELMRSTAWLEANEVEVGGYVRLAFEELKVDDDGWVRSISSCPEIQPGDGCVVSGTFTHLNDDVHELTFVGSDVVLQPTGLHPLWSEDRDGWVRTHELEVGEKLRSEHGPLEIATIRRLEGAHQVFNLEVASDQTYLVSDSAILSHNMCDGVETPHTVSESRPPNKARQASRTRFSNRSGQMAAGR